MNPDRPLRIGAVQVDGLAHYQIGYWRRRGALFVPSGGYVIVDDRDLGALFLGIRDARRTMAALVRRQS